MDGEEDVKAGLDLYEMTDILVEMGTWHALVRIHLCMRLFESHLSVYCEVIKSLSHTELGWRGKQCVSVRGQSHQ